MTEDLQLGKYELQRDWVERNSARFHTQGQAHRWP